MTGKPKRRHCLRFSLRSMLVVLTVLGVWLGLQVNRANTQRRIVKWVTENGGWVDYDWFMGEDYDYDYGFVLGNEPSGTFQPPGPIWIRRLIGDEYFQSVVVVDAPHAELQDLSPLVKLTTLKVLYLKGTLINNVSPLSSLTQLENLNLEDTSVREIYALASLKELKCLNLSHTAVSDFTSLSCLSKLEWLALVGTQIEDTSPLANLTELKWLFLSDTKVADLSPLADLVSLERLVLDRTLVKDLTPLGDLTSLSYLYIVGAPVSNQEVLELRQALPNCNIICFD